MATAFDSYAPFDSGPGSNVTEDTWRSMMRRGVMTGVVAGVANEMAVFANSTGMQVFIPTGECWIEGHWGQLATQKTQPIAAAHATLARLDRVVARCDFVNNRIEYDVLTGTPAASPTLPSLTQNTSIWEISLAQVSVAAAASTIAAGNVADLRTWGSIRLVADGVTSPQSFTTGVTATVQWPVSQSLDPTIITVSGTNNTTFTCAKAGFYLIETALRLASGTTNLELSIKVNGSRVSAGQGSVLTSCSTGKRLLVGDVVTITAIQTSGSTKAVESGAEETSHLSIARVSP
ncbi:hypothetical protein [Amycolatopsis kentuckyensis]|uniref:hypothetical protein n=1 Tax=Amycolatopsis kentuckyensis TaxID=218823 RepID=UPI000A394C7E|nr:hypothetical protein [Amycolatopsis kentuckyensis]